MIYLIESAGYKEEGGNTTFFKLLKIGYTEDSRKDRRIDQYKLHNPTSKVLFEIPNGTEDHEKRIQYKFKYLKYNGYGNEWFNYSEEIINFFKEIKSLEDIEKNLPKSTSRNYLKQKNIIKRIVNSIYPVSPKLEDNSKEARKYYKNLIDNLGDKILDIENVYNYLKKDFGEESIINYLNKELLRESGKFTDNEELNIKIKKILEEYESLTDIQDKYKLLCESPYPEEVIKIVVNQLHDSDPVKGNYSSLGPQKLKALNYRKGNIQKALGIVTFNPLLLQNHIYQDFKVGDKLTLSEIKQRLVSIYNSINYDKAAKANDLESYFETRLIYITVMDGKTGKKKQTKGYELLSQKYILTETKTD